jgi:NAD-dependent dihydropyrimidine dehydrogenase PreA subunit
MTSECTCTVQAPAYTTDINTLEYNPALCINCGMCTIVCPHAVFAPDGKVARLVRPEACIECGACQRNCPTGAIAVDSGECGCAAGMIQAALARRRELFRGLGPGTEEGYENECQCDR